MRALKDLVSVEEADDCDELLAGFYNSGTLRPAQEVEAVRTSIHVV